MSAVPFATSAGPIVRNGAPAAGIVGNCCFFQLGICGGLSTNFYVRTGDVIGKAAVKYQSVCYEIGNLAPPCVPSGGTLLAASQYQTFLNCVTCGQTGPCCDFTIQAIRTTLNGFSDCCAQLNGMIFDLPFFGLANTLCSFRKDNVISVDGCTPVPVGQISLEATVNSSTLEVRLALNANYGFGSRTMTGVALNAYAQFCAGGPISFPLTVTSGSGGLNNCLSLGGAATLLKVSV